MKRIIVAVMAMCFMTASCSRNSVGAGFPKTRVDQPLNGRGANKGNIKPMSPGTIKGSNKIGPTSRPGSK